MANTPIQQTPRGPWHGSTLLQDTGLHLQVCVGASGRVRVRNKGTRRRGSVVGTMGMLVGGEKGRAPSARMRTLLRRRQVLHTNSANDLNRTCTMHDLTL